MNVVYLVLFVLSNDGFTSQSIPQANMAQCQANAKMFNTNRNNEIINNSYSTKSKAQSALCIVGIK